MESGLCTPSSCLSGELHFDLSHLSFEQKLIDLFFLLNQSTSVCYCLPARSSLRYCYSTGSRSLRRRSRLLHRFDRVVVSLPRLGLLSSSNASLIFSVLTASFSQGSLPTETCRRWTRFPLDLVSLSISFLSSRSIEVFR